MDAKKRPEKLPVWIRAKARGAGVSLPSGAPYVQGFFDSSTSAAGQAYLHEREARLLFLALVQAAGCLQALAREMDLDESESRVHLNSSPNGPVSFPRIDEDLPLRRVLREADAAIERVFRHPAAPGWVNPFEAFTTTDGEG
uniref:hypothetical protein n=1 Tax=Stappia sp. TaxID=1870903 RepID=UPI003BA9800B